MKSLLLLLFSLCVAGLGHAQNFDKGKEINGTCAGCHGQYGEGGKKGEYPRIAGQPAGHIEEQLRAFRDRKRANMPMFPYTRERELPEEDIRAVAAYLASIMLPTRYPEFKETDDALTRLTLMEKVMIVPRTPGDLQNGKAIYDEECAMCHRKDGTGRKTYPRLVGQYTSYLKKQVAAFIAGERRHDEDEIGGILNKLKPQDIDDVLAYVTSLQGQE